MSSDGYGRCGRCGLPAEGLRRVDLDGHDGPLLCSPCWLARREAIDGEDLEESARVALYVELVGAGLGPRTITSYTRSIWSAQRWFRAQGWYLSTARPDQVAEYAATLPHTFGSQNLLRAALRRYWELVQHPRPPVGAIRVPPKPEMVCKALDEDDARILAKAARARGDLKGLAVLLGLYQALRREEIATLTWSSFDDGWMTVQGKGAKTRTIPVHPVVADALAATHQTGPYLFSGRYGGTCNPATIWRWVSDVAEEAGLAATRCHWLRHTALATQNDATGDLRTVQHFAGHSRPETTQGYTRATRRRLQEAVLAIDY